MLGRGEGAIVKVLWAPDRHLGAYVEKVTGADMLLWPGSCVVHDAFKGHAPKAPKAQHPDRAAVIAHPESPAPVLELADVVGSTSQLIKAARKLPNQKLIVATDNGIFYKMKQAAPGKVFLEAPTVGAGATCVSCAHCPWMAMNDLAKVVHVLETGQNEIRIDEAIRAKTYKSTMRMLEFAKSMKELPRTRVTA